MEQNQQHQYCCPDLISSDYAFAFDDPAFSDRILKLLIFDDSLEEKRDSGSTGECTMNHLFSSLKQRKETIPESQKEEASFMGVIKFMYNSKLLTKDSQNDLLGALLAADKFSVPSCVKYCCKLLSSFPMTAELAFCYIDLPSIISIDDIHPLLNQAKKFLLSILKDISKYRKDIIKLSLEGIKIILSSDDLTADSEDDAYDLLVEWTEKHFADSEQRRSILTTEMFDLIRLQNMTPQKLNKVVGEFFNSSHLEQNAVKLMTLVLNENKSSLPRHPRAYKVLPVAVVTFNVPVRQCVVFLDLKREECKDVTYIESQTFTFDENVFYLVVKRYKDETFACYLHLKTRKKQSDLVVRFKFAARQKDSPHEFVKRHETLTYTFKLGETMGWGYQNIFSTTWDGVMDENNSFFINGILHLRVEIMLLTENKD